MLARRIPAQLSYVKCACEDRLMLSCIYENVKMQRVALIETITRMMTRGVLKS